MKRIKKSAAPPIVPKSAAKAAPRPKPLIRNDAEYFRLRIGDVIEINGGEYEIVFINVCRARCVPLTKKKVEYETVEGTKVRFEAEYASINISPNSEVKILRRPSL